MWRKLCVLMVVSAMVGVVSAEKGERIITDPDAFSMDPNGSQGTRVDYFLEDFEAGMPAGWTVIDHNADGYMWQVGYSIDMPDPPNYGTAYAFYSDDDAGSGAPPSNPEELVSPVIDITGLSGIGLVYDYGFTFFVSGEMGTCEISVDGGAWTQIAVYSSAGMTGYEVYDLASHLPASTIQVRFLYFDASGSWGWGYAVDNVRITDDLPQPPPECDYVRSCGPYGAGSSWIGDMAYNPNTGSMYQVDVGGSNGIIEWDVASCTQLNYCTGVPWSISQRGIAYDPTENVCYVGSWNNAGSEIYVIEPPPSCGLVRTIYVSAAYNSVSGLAWDDDLGLVWVMTNADPDYLYAIDGMTGTIIHGPYAVAWGTGTDGYDGAGLAWMPGNSRAGDLLAVNQYSNNFEFLDKTNGMSVGFCGLVSPTTFGWGVGHVWYEPAGWASEIYSFMDNEHLLGGELCPGPSDLTCVVSPGSAVELSWVNNDTYTEIKVFRNGAEVASLPGDATNHIDSPGVMGNFVYYVQGYIVDEICTASNECEAGIAGVLVYEFDFNLSGCAFTPATVCPDVAGCPNGIPEWQWGAPTYGPDPGGLTCDNVPLTNCWGTNLAAAYSNDCCSRLTSPVLYLDQGGQMEVCHWYDIETNYDGGNVKVSTDGGSTWTVITPVAGYDATISTSTSFYACIVDMEDGYTGHVSTWMKSFFDLTPYAGQNFMVAFDFGSDASVTYPGWYLKWVKVYGPPVDVAEGGTPITGPFALENARPNPFTGMTEISFSLPVEAHTDLKVFDASGRLIRTLENGVLGAGSHVSMWDGRDNAGRTVTAGIYFYKLNAADKQAVKKVVLMR